MTWLATDVTLQTLTWPELDPLVVVFAAGVEVDEFAADAMPAPRPPPTASAGLRRHSCADCQHLAAMARPAPPRPDDVRRRRGNGACQACHQHD
jgi:hypothetical protein